MGCGTSLHCYICLAADGIQLGGYVGVRGWRPADSNGFAGADAALRTAMQSHRFRERPLWMMIPTDDSHCIPWKLAKPSIKMLSEMPGFHLEKVYGRGHGVGDWHDSFLKRFFKSIR